MQRPTINPLFAAQPAAAPSKAQPASGAAFGEMLSRELGNRQAAPAEAPPRVPQAAPAAERARSPTRQSQPAPGIDAGAASVRARQESQRAQDRRDNDTRADAADKAQAANADSAGRPASPGDTSADKTTDKSTDRRADKTSDQVADNDATDAAHAADEAASAAAAGTAAAALLALVNSLAPRQNVPETSAAVADTVADPKLATQKSAAFQPGGSTDVNGDDTAQHDPAFDALLAQAAHATQARDAARGAGTERNLPRAQLDAMASATGSTTGQASELAAKASSTTVQAGIAQAAFERDAAKAFDGTVLPPAAAIGTAAAAAGVMPDAGQGAGESLAPRVGTPAWDNALGQKVVWMAAGAEQSASLTLNPPDLGPLQVVINVSNTHAEATFTAAQPEVRQALEAAMPRLKEMLADAGISLGQTSVGAGSPDQGSAQARQQAQELARHSAVGRSPADGTLAQPVRVTRSSTRGNGLVDTFA